MRTWLRENWVEAATYVGLACLLVLILWQWAHGNGFTDVRERLP